MREPTRRWQLYEPQFKKECKKKPYRNSSKLQRRRATARFTHLFTELEPHKYKRISNLRFHITPRPSRHPAWIWSISASSISFPALHKSRSAKASVHRSLMLLSEFSERLKLLPCVSSCGNVCFIRAFSPRRSKKNNHNAEQHCCTLYLAHSQRRAKALKDDLEPKWLPRKPHIKANAHHETTK